MRPLRMHILFILIGLFWVVGARADTIFYPLITYKCNATANRIDISYKMLQGKKGKNFHYSDADGTYSPWHMVDIHNVQGVRTVSHEQKIIKHCELNTGEYTVTIEPHVFNSYFGDRQCSDTISATITIDHVDKEILPPTSFEQFCLGNEPIISKIRVLAKNDQVKIKHKPKFTFY